MVAYQPRPTFTHAHGREPNWRNLMIQNACGKLPRLEQFLRSESLDEREAERLYRARRPSRPAGNSSGEQAK